MGIRMPLALIREPLFLLIVSSRDIFPSQFTHAFSFGQIEGDDLVHGIAGFLDVVEQDPRRTPRQLLHILPDGRQPGHTVPVSYTHLKADTLRDCLLAAGRYGLTGLPLRYKLKLAWCMVRYKMSFADGVALYGKYVGNWGGTATCWRFDAKNGDTVVKSVTLCPSHRLHLEVTPSATVLQLSLIHI